MRTASGGPAAFDSVHVTEVHIETMKNMQGDVSISGTAVYVSSQTGLRYGSTTRNVWSAKTLGAMQAMLDAMEEDVLAAVFGESPAGGVQTLPIDPTGGVPGL